MEFIIKVSRFFAEPYIMEGKVQGIHQRKQAEYTVRRTVYAGENPEEVKNTFIENTANTIKGHNISEHNRVLYHRNTKRAVKQMQVWVITEMS